MTTRETIADVILGRSGFVIDGVLYFLSADSFNPPGMRGRVNLAQIMRDGLHLERSDGRDLVFPLSTGCDVSGDVVTVFGNDQRHPGYNRLARSARPRFGRVPYFARRVRWGLVDDRLVEDNLGLSRVGEEGEEVVVAESSVSRAGDMVAFRFHNHELHEALVFDGPDSELVVAGPFVTYTSREAAGL